MTFVSYAQNDEDILLWRALKAVEHGFYIDVGAAIIDDYSVSRAFYERGWRGVNIEPVPELCGAVKAARPDDVTLPIALGSAEGERDFFIIPETGLSTLDPAIAEAHRAAGWRVEPGRVRVGTLTRICRQYAEGPIHFLKIDVEGAEAEVLAGADFSAFRPWILVIEATWPGRPDASHAAWEPALLAEGYRFAWFDGLNRFYVAAEQEGELARYFRAPPNVWDGFVRFDGKQAKKLATAETECRRIEGVLAGKEKDFAAEIAAAGAEAFGLRRAYFAELETNAVRERELGKSQAENTLLAEQFGRARAHSERLERLFAELRLSEGPRSLRAVLPLARLLRWLGKIRSPRLPRFAPRALARALLRPFWRLAKPFIRPLAWRARSFMLGPTAERLAELSALQQRLAESSRRLAEQGQAKANNAELEAALLTIALAGEARAPDQQS